MNFSSNANYKKWLAYGHATGVFERTPGNTPVSINGKPKKCSTTTCLRQKI
jgi:hypothetical protein